MRRFSIPQLFSKEGGQNGHMGQNPEAMGNCLRTQGLMPIRGHRKHREGGSPVATLCRPPVLCREDQRAFSPEDSGKAGVDEKCLLPYQLTQDVVVIKPSASGAAPNDPL